MTSALLLPGNPRRIATVRVDGLRFHRQEGGPGGPRLLARPNPGIEAGVIEIPLVLGYADEVANGRIGAPRSVPKRRARVKSSGTPASRNGRMSVAASINSIDGRLVGSNGGVGGSSAACGTSMGFCALTALAADAVSRFSRNQRARKFSESFIRQSDSARRLKNGCST